MTGLTLSDRLQQIASSKIKFSIESSLLKEVIRKIAHIVPNNDQNPVLKGIQFDLTKTTQGDFILKVIATDLDLALLAAVKQVSASAEGTIVIPGDKLLDIVKLVDSDEVSFEADSGSVRIVAGQTSWTLMLLPLSDYPPLPNLLDLSFVKIKKESFLQALLSVRYAACQDFSRPEFSSIEVRGKKMTASDGSRLQQIFFDSPIEFQIPVGAVEDLVRILKVFNGEHIAIGLAGFKLVFGIGSDLFIASRLLSVFPDVENLILRPAISNINILTVDRKALLYAVNRVRVVSDKHSGAITLDIDSKSISVKAADNVGNFSVEPVEASWDSSPHNVVVQHQLLIDMLNMYSGDICTFYLGEDRAFRRSPILLRDEDLGFVGIVQQLAMDWSLS